MKSDAMLLCVLTALFGGLGWHSSSTFVKSAATSMGDLKAAKNSMAAYSAAAAAAAGGGGSGGDSRYMMGAPSTGSMSFQPREAVDYGDVNNGRAAVYDPGDELLRALNAELATNGQELGVLPEEPDYADTVFNELEVANKFEMMRKLERDLREEQEFVTKSALLMKLLADPALEILPVVYVEDNSIDETDDNDLYASEVADGRVSKRSRYYRRYPWKRHNRNRSTYEPELRYACTPSKEDVFKLLVNLHENRKGNHSKTVNFCNRKRPAKAVFTNIRFLG